MLYKKKIYALFILLLVSFKETYSMDEVKQVRFCWNTPEIYSLGEETKRNNLHKWHWKHFGNSAWDWSSQYRMWYWKNNYSYSSENNLIEDSMRWSRDYDRQKAEGVVFPFLVNTISNLYKVSDFAGCEVAKLNDHIGVLVKILDEVVHTEGVNKKGKDKEATMLEDIHRIMKDIHNGLIEHQVKSILTYFFTLIGFSMVFNKMLNAIEKKIFTQNKKQ